MVDEWMRDDGWGMDRLEREPGNWRRGVITDQCREIESNAKAGEGFGNPPSIHPSSAHRQVAEAAISPF